MWPLGLVLLFAFAAQQNPSTLGGAYVGKIPQGLNLQIDRSRSRRVSPQDPANQNVCYFIRSYRFQREDGLAPVPAGVTTCTPANAFRQKQVTAQPRLMYVPLGLQPAGQDNPQK